MMMQQQPQEQEQGLEQAGNEQPSDPSSFPPPPPSMEMPLPPPADHRMAAMGWRAPPPPLHLHLPTPKTSLCKILLHYLLLFLLLVVPFILLLITTFLPVSTFIIGFSTTDSLFLYPNLDDQNSAIDVEYAPYAPCAMLKKDGCDIITTDTVDSWNNAFTGNLANPFRDMVQNAGINYDQSPACSEANDMGKKKGKGLVSPSQSVTAPTHRFLGHLHRGVVVAESMKYPPPPPPLEGHGKGVDFRLSSRLPHSASASLFVTCDADLFGEPMVNLTTAKGVNLASLYPDWPTNSEVDENTIIAASADISISYNPSVVSCDDYVSRCVSQARDAFILTTSHQLFYCGGEASSRSTMHQVREATVIICSLTTREHSQAVAGLVKVDVTASYALSFAASVMNYRLKGRPEPIWATAHPLSILYLITISLLFIAIALVAFAGFAVPYHRRQLCEMSATLERDATVAAEIVYRIQTSYGPPTLPGSGSYPLYPAAPGGNQRGNSWNPNTIDGGNNGNTTATPITAAAAEEGSNGADGEETSTGPSQLLLLRPPPPPLLPPSALMYNPELHVGVNVMPYLFPAMLPGNGAGGMMYSSPEPNPEDGTDAAMSEYGEGYYLSREDEEAEEQAAEQEVEVEVPPQSLLESSGSSAAPLGDVTEEALVDQEPLHLVASESMEPVEVLSPEHVELLVPPPTNDNMSDHVSSDVAAETEAWSDADEPTAAQAEGGPATHSTPRAVDPRQVPNVEPHTAASAAPPPHPSPRSSSINGSDRESGTSGTSESRGKKSRSEFSSIHRLVHRVRQWKRGRTMRPPPNAVIPSSSDDDHEDDVSGRPLYPEASAHEQVYQHYIRRANQTFRRLRKSQINLLLQIFIYSQVIIVGAFIFLAVLFALHITGVIDQVPRLLAHTTDKHKVNSRVVTPAFLGVGSVSMLCLVAAFIVERRIQTKKIL